MRNRSGIAVAIIRLCEGFDEMECVLGAKKGNLFA